MRRAIAIVAVLIMSSPAATDDWRSNADSHFQFVATFDGSATPGEFREFAVVFEFDLLEPGNGRLRVSVDLTAADMGDPDINTVLYEPDWFDTDRFHEAVFESSDITELSPDAFVANGLLDLKGTRKPVAVPFTWTRSGDTASMAGELSLNRSDFAVGSGEWESGDSIGIDVKLLFNVQLEREK